MRANEAFRLLAVMAASGFAELRHERYHLRLVREIENLEDTIYAQKFMLAILGIVAGIGWYL